MSLIKKKIYNFFISSLLISLIALTSCRRNTEIVNLLFESKWTSKNPDITLNEPEESSFIILNNLIVNISIGYAVNSNEVEFYKKNENHLFGYDCESFLFSGNVKKYEDKIVLKITNDKVMDFKYETICFYSN